MDTPQAPTYLTTYTLKQFLFSKAIVRAWAIGYAAVSYTYGLMAYMQQRPIYGNNSTISTIAISAYPDTNPFNISKLPDMTNTQFGVLCSLNGPEAFVHFRRLRYPDPEINADSEIVQAAIKRQGADVIDNLVLRIKAYSMNRKK